MPRVSPLSPGILKETSPPYAEGTGPRPSLLCGKHLEPSATASLPSIPPEGFLWEQKGPPRTGSLPECAVPIQRERPQWPAEQKEGRRSGCCSWVLSHPHHRQTFPLNSSSQGALPSTTALPGHCQTPSGYGHGIPPSGRGPHRLYCATCWWEVAA